MPELLIELFGEEIPARMQARGAEDLRRLLTDALAPLGPLAPVSFAGPRRIAYAAEVAAAVPPTSISERGPRTAAPEQALAGFLRKHQASRDQLRQEGDYWVLHKSAPAENAAALIARVVPPLLRRFPWSKSMRWGAGSSFVWVRPLRRIICLLDRRPLSFGLQDGADDGHGLHAGNVTEGHRFLSPGPIVVNSLDDWKTSLRHAHVVVNAEERKSLISDGLASLAAAHALTIVDDPALVDEVAGLVEWPVPLLGRIDQAAMQLPPEVRQVSMRVNQRYFALRHLDGSPASWFGFVANLTTSDLCATIIAGNERVLRARFADARHFWDLDRATPLEARVAALDGIIFHARLGSQGQRARRLQRLAGHIAPLVGAPVASAGRAAWLAKADLTTAMVGEFPELQGVMGRYYTLHDGADPAVADAIRDHYAPRGPADFVPDQPVSIAVALADKLDLLTGFFAIGEKPTGSGDPYALRRAGLGIIRIIRDNRLRLRLSDLIRFAGSALPEVPDPAEIMAFLAERLRIQLRAEGARHDVLEAVFATGSDDDFTRLLSRTDAIAALLGTADGADLLTAYRRAANILRIEEAKDGAFDQPPEPHLLQAPEEARLAEAIATTAPAIANELTNENFAAAMRAMAGLRPRLDDFFQNVTVNHPDAALRHNRLRLLASLRSTLDSVADFARIEG
jgi:glycyl-tRNA synthetase beta chain